MGFLLRLLGLKSRDPVVPVVRLSGVLSPSGAFGRSALSLQRVQGLLRKAFSMKGAAAVALVINSPGGSAAQSSLIAQRIRHLAREKNLPVIAFVEDVAASGGYWLACAGDEIFVDASSIVGSIGVISSGFGFTEAIKKLGIERRVHTAGAKKGMLDAFQAEKPEDVQHLEALQSEIHERFKAWVKERRGIKLKASEAELFSGAFWTGQRALALGLVDGIAEARSKLRERFGQNVKLIAVEAKRSFFRRLGRGGTSGPDDWFAGALAAVEERSLWQRFGL